MDINNINFHPPVLDKIIMRMLPHNINGKAIIDLGCGIGDWGYLLRTRKEGEFYLHGVDYNKERLEKIPRGIYDRLTVKDFRKSVCLDEFYHYSLCIQVIEHLEREKGFKLLREINNKCTIKSIVTTPLGYMEDEYHFSGWSEYDLQSFGYKTMRISYNVLPRSLMVMDKIRRFFFKRGTGKLLIGVKSYLV